LCRGRARVALGHAAQDRARLHRLALRDRLLAQHAVGGGVDLQGHLVGLQLGDRLVRLYRIAGVLQPAGDRRLAHRFAQGGHRDVDAFAAAGARIAGAVAGRLAGAVTTAGRRRGPAFRRVALLRGGGLARRLGGLALGDPAQQGADLDRLAGGHQHLADRAGGGCVDLQGHLVGLQLDDRLVGADRFALVLQPVRDGRLAYRFAQARNRDVGRHVRPRFAAAPGRRRVARS
jgi:hypothetical protein